MATVQHISNKHPDGTLIGQSSTDLVAFHGGTPRAQYTFSGTAGTLSISAQSVSGSNNAFAFSSSAQFNDLINMVKDLRAMMISFGLAVNS